ENSQFCRSLIKNNQLRVYQESTPTNDIFSSCPGRSPGAKLGQVHYRKTEEAGYDSSQDHADRR
ncbi:MAG: hypothetical protein KC652_06510, partial [Cyanobacteria bacterium HKST-UBA01]|nr:hypothetical protein [Cyanobacteria bacterium HKST-UBA01]